jgi:hypothetical protein
VVLGEARQLAIDMNLVAALGWIVGHDRVHGAII